MQIDDNTLYNTLLGALGVAWGIVTAGWSRLTGRVSKIEEGHVSRAEIERLKESIVKKDEFRDYAERADQSRVELRDSVIKLFDRIDEVKDLVLKLKQGG